MKKNLVLLALIGFAMCTLCGCGGKSDTSEVEQQITEEEQQNSEITVKGADGTIYESYQECCAAEDFQAAHQYLAKMENSDDWQGDLGEAKEYVFKQEALYLMSIGDAAAQKRIIFLLKEEGASDSRIDMLMDLAIDAEDEDFVKSLTKQYKNDISSDILRKIVEFLYIEKGEGNLDFVQTLLNRYNKNSLLLDAAVEKGDEDLVVSLAQQVSGSIDFPTFKGVMDFLELRNNNNYQRLFTTLASNVEDDELLEYATAKKQMTVVNNIHISELERDLKSLLDESDFNIITKGIHEDDVSVDGPQCNERISRFNQKCIKVLRKAINYKQLKMANRAINLMKPNIVTYSGNSANPKVDGVTVGYSQMYIQYVNSDINEAKNILNEAVRSGAFK